MVGTRNRLTFHTGWAFAPAPATSAERSGVAASNSLQDATEVNGDRMTRRAINQRSLTRDAESGDYVTSDGRYRLSPYNDPTEVTRGKGPRRWQVVDTLGRELPWSVSTLREFRASHCKPTGHYSTTATEETDE